ncbi:hypothetical protein [Massilia antarctica]|uniref:hypothetical protein n=1 Tax=Massilia antarctica TaxID=2765360 RepID=UPI0006BB85D5|nr:hypothetical protein [Massilia sp. H27-R4]MCY0915020.1 hypothetical protein [Massilia sp. H27-R4]CUI06988.1 hypothetical protein BN2497_8753 [Janthinobacterium sp. CG23_2]CUU30774.1 hypothetical protein BN3177_8753 [Janthinobacterium sp. CG23_2]
MNHVRPLALALLVAVSQASAQDVLLAGKAQRVVLLAYGAEGCPDPCEARKPQSDASQWVCISNGGGCESMEVKVEQVFWGDAGGTTRVVKQGIGEWGPRFTDWRGQVVVNQESGSISWSPAHVRAGKIYIESKKLRSVRNIKTSDLDPDDDDLVALDSLLKRVRQSTEGQQAPNVGGRK